MQPAGWFLIAVIAVLAIGIIASKKKSANDESEKK